MRAYWMQTKSVLKKIIDHARRIHKMQFRNSFKISSNWLDILKLFLKLQVADPKNNIETSENRLYQKLTTVKFWK